MEPTPDSWGSTNDIITVAIGGLGILSAAWAAYEARRSANLLRSASSRQLAVHAWIVEAKENPDDPAPRERFEVVVRNHGVPVYIDKVFVEIINPRGRVHGRIQAYEIGGPRIIARDAAKPRESKPLASNAAWEGASIWMPLRDPQFGGSKTWRFRAVVVTKCGAELDYYIDTTADFVKRPMAEVGVLAHFNDTLYGLRFAPPPAIPLAASPLSRYRKLMRPSPLFIVLGLILAGAGFGTTQWVRSDLANRPVNSRQVAWEVGPEIINWDPKPAPPRPAGTVRDVRDENPEEWFGPSTPKRHTPRHKITAFGWAFFAAGLGFVGVGVTRRRQHSE